VVCRCGDKSRSLLAVGYATGEIRIFNYLSKTLLATLPGHTAAVACLRDASSAEAGGEQWLISGGCDCDCVVWDLLSMTAVCRLRGHRDAVTDALLLRAAGRRLLVTASKDTLLKVWCMDGRHCVQTVVGHRCEVWSLAALSPAGGGADAVVVCSGGSDGQLRGFALAPALLAAAAAAAGGVALSDSAAGDEEAVLVAIGSVPGAPAGDRCVRLCLNAAGGTLAAQSTGRVVEVCVCVPRVCAQVTCVCL